MQLVSLGIIFLSQLAEICSCFNFGESVCVSFQLFLLCFSTGLRSVILCFLQAIINSTITPNMTFTKTSHKFGQWADSRANTVYGLGFSSEAHLSKVSPARDPASLRSVLVS